MGADPLISRRNGGGHQTRTIPLVAVASFVALLATGCATTAPDRAERMPRGYVYYLDGAGGGGITNWGGGVRKGLVDAGYDGAGEMFKWQTGFGVLADQTASNKYKRDKADKLAQEMVKYRQEFPRGPVTVIGLSAGTVIAVFALEALPSDLMVENVVLLSGSLSATHDLTRALRHVRGKMYVSTSDRDVVLGALLPVAGTADRGSGTTATIGVEGPQMPPGASAETRNLYTSKLVVVPWRSEFARYGNAGGHTDTVAAPFIERYVAPLVETTTAVQFASTAAAPRGTVENPDYRRWARFPVGSSVSFDGQQTVDGETRPIRIRTTLIKKTPTVLVLRREQLDAAGQHEAGLLDQTLYESANIAPEEHPTTHPECKIRELPAAEIQVGSQRLSCQVRSIAVPADFSDWGSHPQATVYSSESVPGGIVQADIQTHFGGKSVTIKGRLVRYHVPAK